MKFRLLLILILILILAGCDTDPTPAPESVHTVPSTEATQPTQEETIPPTTLPPDPIDVLLESMSLEERVGQLFLARCNSAVAAEDAARYHLGGYVLFGVDFENQTVQSVTDTIASYQDQASIPLLIAVDEEGGTVNRVSRYSQFRSSPFPSAKNLYTQGGTELLLSTEEEKCQLLASLGINVNLGPVCDITTQYGAILYHRSLGQSPEVTSDIIAQIVQLMSRNHIGSVLKHFPGYGNNPRSRSFGGCRLIATDYRSLEDLEACDLIPFHGGIEAGADTIMVSHTIVTCLDPELPASLSPAVHQYLRQEMDFEGVIITDDLVMAASTDAYGAGEAAVLAVLAGNDLLCCTEYAVQYEAVLDAVLTGRIDYYRLTEAVRRILQWKQELGLI